MNMSDPKKNVEPIRAEEITEPALKLGFMQRRELKRAAARHLSDEQMAFLVTGYSDLGWAGARPAMEIRRMCAILERHKLRFGCITIFHLSDEALYLYAYGFDRELALGDIQQTVFQYQDVVRSIQQTFAWLGRKKQNKLIAEAYGNAVRALSHCKRIDIPA